MNIYEEKVDKNNQLL